MEPGLYNENNELIMSWADLIKQEKIKIKDTNELFCVSKNGCSGSYLIIDESINAILTECIEDRDIEKIYIPKSVTNIIADAFDTDDLKHIEVDKDNIYYSSEDGVLFNKEQTKLIKYPNEKDSENYIINEKIENIGFGAFYFCSKLKELTIPKNVTKISDYCFCYSKIDKITIKGDITIGEAAFMFSKIQELSLPKNIKEIKERAFNSCDRLTTIKYPGKEKDLKNIKGWEYIFERNNITMENIQFQKTLEDLINEGYTLTEANRELKQQTER